MRWSTGLCVCKHLRHSLSSAEMWSDWSTQKWLKQRSVCRVFFSNNKENRTIPWISMTLCTLIYGLCDCITYLPRSVQNMYKQISFSCCVLSVRFSWHFESQNGNLSQSLDQCLAVQQLAGHRASHRLGAYFQILDTRLLRRASSFEKITTTAINCFIWTENHTPHTSEISFIHSFNVSYSHFVQSCTLSTFQQLIWHSWGPKTLFMEMSKD